MRWDKYKVFLTILFLVVFLSRLYFSLGIEGFTNDSYYHLRLAEHIQETGKPLYNDDLSYGGRSYYYPPLFHYSIAFLSLFIPIELAANILPNIFFSSMVFLIFGIAYNITKNKKASMIASLIFSFAPVSYILPVNKITPYSLAVPLLFSFIYFFTKKKIKLNYTLVSLVLLVLTHPSGIILAIGLLIYPLLMNLLGMRVRKGEKEISLFALFFSLWSLFLFYKQSFLAQGVSVIWQNYPLVLAETTFSNPSLFSLIYMVGMISLFLGVLGGYSILFKKPKQDSVLILAFALVVFLPLWLELLTVKEGILYLSGFLSLLAAEGYNSRSEYVGKTRFSWWKKYTIIFFVAFFLVSQVIPVYETARNEASETPNKADIEALEWIKNNTPKDAVITSPLNTGHLVTYFAERKNVMDTNFLMASNVDERFQDVKQIYTAAIQSQALKAMEKYDSKYLYLGQEAKSKYTENLDYTRGDCFEKIYDKKVKIYKLVCEGGVESGPEQ